jgi:Domain of unknown function (DUF222)/HNH endonuclease
MNPNSVKAMKAMQAMSAMKDVAAWESADDLMEFVVGAEQLVRMAVALRYRALSALAGHPLYQEDPVREAGLEAACALRICERTAQNQVAEAVTLTRLFPETLGRLAAGDVQQAQVRALIEATVPLDDATARRVQDLVLPRMPEQNPAATRKALSRAVIKADPAGAEARRERAVAERRVAHYPESDGMSTVAATLPAEQAVHAMNAIDAHARAARTRNPEDTRTLDQARADSFYRLVTGNATASPAALVQITVPLDTLLGIDQEPGELSGYGPITAGAARELAANQDSIWQRLLTAPDTGLVIKTDPTSYRPTAEVRRHVSARDGHCTFPTCSMPATRTDLDHIVPFNHKRPDQGGPTTPDNLHPLCRYHHRLKTHAGWTVHRSETNPTATAANMTTTPATTTTTWTSPSGRHYTTTAAA